MGEYQMHFAFCTHPFIFAQLSSKKVNFILCDRY